MAVRPQRMEHPLPVTTIEALFEELTRRTQMSAIVGNRGAYFGALYTLMTGRVAEGIQDGRFTRPDRLEHLACHFAGRYLNALDLHATGQAAPKSWAVSFEAAERWRPVILQHLLLGMNAHINFDLGIAASQISLEEGDAGLAAVHGDFMEINTVLAELMTDVQDRLASVSPWMGIIDTLAGDRDEAAFNFSMVKARDAAWGVAERHVRLSATGQAAMELALDTAVATFARVIHKPGRIVSTLAVPVRMREIASVEEVVEALGVPPARVAGS